VFEREKCQVHSENTAVLSAVFHSHFCHMHTFFLSTSVSLCSQDTFLDLNIQVNYVLVIQLTYYRHCYKVYFFEHINLKLMD
jgi:hypothetical protein